MDKDLLEGFARYLEPQAALVHKDPHCAGPSITISRQMGAGGIAIANLLADQLSTRCCRVWVVFEKNLAQLVWQNHHLPAPVGRFFDEGIPQAIHDTVQELLGIRITDWNQVEHTAATILRLAGRGDVIFVGRGANIITANQKAVLRVRLIAPFAKRVRQIEEHYRLGTQEAVELISATDDMRRRYIKHYFRAEIDDPINYHFVINTGAIGYQETAHIIAEATMNIQSLA